MRKETDADQIDFNKKILHMSWHPFEDSIAIAATNNVRTSKCIFPDFANLVALAFRLLCIVEIGSMRKRPAGHIPSAFFALRAMGSQISLVPGFTTLFMHSTLLSGETNKYHGW